MPFPRFSILYGWQAETLRDEIVRRVYQPSDVLPSKHRLLHKSASMKLAFHMNAPSKWCGIPITEQAVKTR